MADMYPEKQFAADWISENRGRLSDFDLKIWEYAEPAWREYRSAEAYCDLLRSEGFDVEEGSAGMPTAFCATFGDEGPVLGAYAEYDAVPGTSQQAVPYRAARENLHPYAPGHTDPHSMLGVASLGAALAAKRAIERYNLPATIKFFGEPAEKMCGSKPVHAARGYYDEVDAFVAYHPHRRNTAVLDTHCGSYWSAVFSFECRKPEKWAGESVSPGSASPHAAARCPGALDALCLMYTNTKYTKEAMFPHTGTWTLNEFVLVAGDATSDNLPPRFSQIQYAWRSPSLDIQRRIYDVLQENARAAAQATGCEVSVRTVTRTRVGLANHAMCDLAYGNLERAGPPSYSEEARQFGRKIQENLGITPMRNPFLPEHETLTTPADHEENLRRSLPEWQSSFTSDDYVEYTWHAPTVRLHTARPRLQPPHAGFTYPPWANNALAGKPELVDPGMFVAAEAMAATLLDLITCPDHLASARAEFERRTGGGIGGSDWVAPLLPRDFAPPVDLRWPEYINTPRGTEWWVPTPRSDASRYL